MVIKQPALYSIRVSVTTALVAPLLYLAIAGSADPTESGFAFVWALAAIGIGCACALPAIFILDKGIRILTAKSLTLNQVRFGLSVISMVICFIALALICGWDNFDTIYFKLFVTYVVIAIIAIWLYRLNPNAAPVEL